MSRRNFGRVSGVVIDVCPPHGAWFDRGTLADIRRFLRAGDVQMYERNRRVDREMSLPPRGTADASLDDLFDVVMGDPRPEARRSPWRLLTAIGFFVSGVWLVWGALHPTRYERTLGLGSLGLGLAFLYLAWRLLADRITAPRP